MTVYNTAQKARRVSQVHLRQLALDIRLLPGHQEYRKFIILGRSRTGTNFLRGLLNSHSQIEVFGELFREFSTISWNTPGYTRSKRALTLIQNDPVKFVEKYVFRRFPRRVAAVGFKIFYYHAQQDAWKPVWKYLADRPRLKVIHMKRENILAAHLSRKRAFRSNLWEDNRGVASDEEPIALDYSECLEAFESSRQWEDEGDRLFSCCETLELSYEKLANDTQQEMKRVLHFLGAPFENLRPSTYKQSHQPLAGAISNYSKLKKQFQGSPWAIFFEE